VLLFLKNLIFTLLVPGAVSVFVPLLVFSNKAPVFSVGVVIGVFLLITGGAIYLWCILDFAKVGRGTPAPVDPPKQLVVRGLYGYGRNPMYVGVLNVISGWAFVFHSVTLVIYGVCVATCFHLIVVFYEEPHLEQVFGQNYKKYCTQVNRWLPSRLSRSGSR
jgi:protein-S-isoprenylcysteine O-methyltransferase Ste14